jgi:hypothetical protein
VKEDETDRACSMHGGKRRMHKGFMPEIQQEIDHSDDLYTGGDNSKMDFIGREKIPWYGLDSSGSGKEAVAALVNTVMTLRVP